MASKAGHFSRRDFVRTAAAAAAVSSVMPRFVVGAENDKPLRIGLVGCGGRGSGAANNAITADKGVKIVALADVAKDRLEGCRNDLNKKGMEIKDTQCFLGKDGYKKLLEVDGLDYVILATPPYYRPVHFEACIKAGKNVFTEKPVAVDPVGIRRMLKAGEEAESKKLCVVAGTQRRHQAGYVETIKRLRDGAIGKVMAAQAYWNMGQLWFRKREQGWSEDEWMHRDWVNWCWLSGDHIVEQHVHNLDVINWVLGAHPVEVVCFGSRHRRVTGDQYDNFAADFVYPNHVHLTSMCRQINGTATDVSERVIGEKGVSNCNGWISDQPEVKTNGIDPYVQEHKDLIAAIRSGKPLNETKNVSESTMCAIMARMSAYSGAKVTWDEAMKSDLQLNAPNYELSDENVRAHIPVPGKA